MKIKVYPLKFILICLALSLVLGGIFLFVKKDLTKFASQKSKEGTNKMIVSSLNPAVGATSSTNLTILNKPVGNDLEPGVTLPILMYHYVETAPVETKLKSLYLAPEIFKNQLQLLKDNKFNLVFVSEIANSLRAKENLPAKSLALSFDDAYLDFYTTVFPLLKEHQAKATLYVIINRLEQKNYITRAQLKEMAASGYVEIGSHTFNHPDLRKLKFKDAQFEIKNSRQILEQLSGQSVLTFAYPFGYYLPEFSEIASSTGYQAAVSVSPGTQQSLKNIWLLKRLRPSERQGKVFLDWLAKELGVLK